MNSRNDYVENCKARVAEFLSANRVALRHVKKNNKPIGTVIGFYKHGEARFGFSKCNKLDKYNRHVGIIKAIEDAFEDDTCRYVPHALEAAFNKMCEFVLSDKGVKCLKS